MQRIGGSFAPPLTDELLANYRQLFDAVPERSALRDALDTLYRCALAWWAVPASKAAKRKTPIGFLQDLDQATIATLWESTPWPEEVERFKSVCAAIEEDKARANGEKIDAWRQAVADELWLKQFGTVERATAATYYRVVQLVTRVSPTLAAGVRLLFPDVPADIDARWDAWQAEVAAALAPGGNPPVPRPTLTPTPLRDAAHHLLHHADELAHDREPAVRAA